MTTITAVKRALEETADQLDNDAPLGSIRIKSVVRLIAADAKAVTILANRLSDRGTAGNDAARRNLGDLKRIAADLRFTAERVGAPGCATRLEAADKLAALEWAIDQLTPPEFALTVWGKTVGQLDDAELERAINLSELKADARLALITERDRREAERHCHHCSDTDHEGPFCPNRV